MTIIHDIFVNKRVETQSDIETFKELMYTTETFNNYRSIIINNDDTKLEEPSNEMVIEDTSITPENKDQLFWCCYIGKYGLDKYNEIKHRAGNIEMEEKQRISEYFKNNPNFLKNINQKMTKARIQEIISEIMINNKVSLNVLPAFALYYRVRIIILKENRIYLNISSEDNYDTTILMYKKDHEYNIDICVNDNKIQNIIEKCYCLYSYEKPLKAISNFKMDELLELASKMDVDTSKKIQKNELYGNIARKCIW